MSKKNIILIILGAVLSFFVLFGVLYSHDVNYKTLTADSGFDSSWDSGGWDSGGWDSGSSWDWGSSDSSWGDSDWSGSGYSYGSGEGGLAMLLGIAGIFGMLGVIIAIFTIASIFTKSNNKKSSNTPSIPKPYLPNNSIITDYELKLLKDFGHTEESILEEAYKVYVNIQGAWANNDIDKAREYLSNEIYNQYKSQLATLKLKKQRNVMNSFSYVKGIVSNVRKEGQDGLVIHLTMNVNCVDYLLNEETNTVARGEKDRTWDYVYELSYELHKEGGKLINNCPICNAKLKGKSPTVKCEYCASLVVRKAPRLVMIDKKMIYQKYL